VAPRKLAAVTPPLHDDEFQTAALDIRGTVYHLRELETDVYDRLVKMATDEEDLIDRSLLLRLMVCESAVKPKITPDRLAKMPYSVTRRLGDLVNNMHWSDEFEPPQDEDEDELGEEPKSVDLEPDAAGVVASEV
jgi:hypothetical protein